MKTLPLIGTLLAGSVAAAPLTALSSELGHPPTALFTEPHFQARMVRLMGNSDYQRLVLNFAVSGPVSGTRALVYLTGNRAHQGGSENSLLVYDAQLDALKVWLKTDHHLITFEEDQWRTPNHLPAEVQTAIRTLSGHP